MMAKLINETQKIILIENLETANSFFKRLKGLLGRKDLSNDSALIIRRCNSIHTFFMQFPLDVIFLDKKFRIKKLFLNVEPHQIIFPVFGASSVIEMKAGALQKSNAQIGDQLNVVD